MWSTAHSAATCFGLSPGVGNARLRYAIDFSVDGDLRFIAHNDAVRMFARAAVRARLPVCFTQGFNPRVRVTLPFPRPVGQASDVERALIELTREVEPAWLIDALQAQLPEGAVVRSAITRPDLTTGLPQWVRYRVDCTGVSGDDISRLVSDLLSLEVAEITRVRHKDGKSRVVNIRPFIDTIDVADDALFVSVFVTESGSASPVEVCRFLGMEACASHHRVRRLEIRWQDNNQQKPVPQGTP